MSAVLEQQPVQVRPMRDHDLAHVHSIEQRAYQFPWSIGVFTDCLRVGYSCWTLELDDEIAGYGIMSVAAQESHILNLCIDPKQHRMGLASILLERLLDTALDHDAQIAYLEVRPSNLGAINLYRKAGFRRVGVRRDYYPAIGGREDAFVMSKNLSNQSSGSVAEQG